MIDDKGNENAGNEESIKDVLTKGIIVNLNLKSGVKLRLVFI